MLRKQLIEEKENEIDAVLSSDMNKEEKNLRVLELEKEIAKL